MIRNRHTFGLIAVCVLVVLSGCGMTEQVWSLNVRGSGEPVDDGFVFNGTVYLGGNSGEVVVHDVRVVFVTANGTPVETVRIGRLNSSYRMKNVTVTLDAPPRRVRVVAGEVESPSDARYSFSGVRRTGPDDGYSPYTQNRTDRGQRG